MRCLIVNPNRPHDVERGQRALAKRLGRLHERRVRDLGCIVCRRLGRGLVNATLHHCRFPVGGGQRASAWYAIPLARPLHQPGYKDAAWPWPEDIAIHGGRQAFARRYGSEPELLAATYALLPYPMPRDEAEVLALGPILTGGRP